MMITISDVKDIFFGLALVLSFMSCLSYIAFFVSLKEVLRSSGRVILVFSGVAQTLYILDRALFLGNIPVTTTHEALVFFAWAVTWSFLLFRWRHSVKNLGTFLSLLVFLILVVASFLPKNIIPLSPTEQTLWLPFHAGVSLLAYGFLGIAFLAGVMYLLQERELKKKRFGYFFSRLPSLDSLDMLNNHCLTVGFSFLTLGIVAGVLWARIVHGFWQCDWTVIPWLFYLVQMHQRLTVGWRGKRAATMAIIGFILAMFTLWGLAYFSGGVHGNV
ncbi:cytochrome C assembly family protein [Desulfotalea psychrophila]|uniref:Related to cytochrome c biogenesis protein CcsA n=1 Tax=Desulfotalea psychrophila (strain LSv54 / DSM 12343) TaxID=177439 RepID=Q6AIM1_DESPS|nr:cytochrome c biogenesis protein CcsA [Desulfotalea psychrophila]CAG37809.1 related to cytochrome c biogenesis protein CcsA [Desulfotalea psychrophila LSv54]